MRVGGSAQQGAGKAEAGGQSKPVDLDINRNVLGDMGEGREAERKRRLGSEAAEGELRPGPRITPGLSLCFYKGSPWAPEAGSAPRD